MNKRRFYQGFRRCFSLAVAAACLIGTVYGEDQGITGATPGGRTERIAAMRKLIEDGNQGSLIDMMKEDLRGTETSERSIRVEIDENRSWTMNRQILGIQHEFSDTYSIFFDGDRLKPEIEAFEKTCAPIPVIRYGGTSSNYVNPINNLGPYGERTPSKTVDQPPGTGELSSAAPYRMGLGECLQMQYANNPDCQIMPCISVFKMTGEDVANLAHFFYDDKNASQWGKLRSEYYGIDNPVDVFYWELSNEVDQYTKERREWYIGRAKEFIDAIRSVKPDAKICVCGPTAPWGRADWATWHENIIPALARDMDAISFHPYYDGHSSESMMGYMQEIKNFLDKTVEEQDIRDAQGNPKDLKVVATEGSRYWNPSDKFKGDATLEAAVCTAHYLNQAFQRPWLEGNMYHCLVSTGIWPYWLNTGSGLLKAAPEKMYELYHQALGDRVVYSDWGEADENGEMVWNNSLTYTRKDSAGLDISAKAQTFSVNAMVSGDNQLNLVLVNKNPFQKIKLDFGLLHNYTLVEESVLSAPNYLTYTVDKETEALTTIEVQEKNEPNFSSYTLPGCTMVVLKLRTKDRLSGGEAAGAGALDEPQADFDAEGVFRDMTQHWARNEVELLHSQGLIQGTGAGLFEPNASITRDEFYTLVSRILGTENAYPGGSVFEDVAEDAWYLAGANTAYAQGLIRDRNFQPQRCITFGELCASANRIYRSKKPVQGGVDADSILSGLDASLLSKEQKDEVAFAVKYGYLYRLYESGPLDFNRTVNRAEAAVMLYRLNASI